MERVAARTAVLDGHEIRQQALDQPDRVLFRQVLDESANSSPPPPDRVGLAQAAAQQGGQSGEDPIARRGGPTCR